MPLVRGFRFLMRPPALEPPGRSSALYVGDMEDHTGKAESFSWLPVDLEPVALRLARADECAFEIGDLASAWSLAGPLDFEQVRYGDETETVLKAIRSVPPKASLLFSEAVNHLRAAVDNVVWHLIEEAHGHLIGWAAGLVAMPIMHSQHGWDAWIHKRVKAGITAYGNDNPLGRRVRTLQPFVDVDSVVPSMGQMLAMLTGQKAEPAHPLLLLQGYSNADKHRSIRLAAARTFSSDNATPLAGQDLSHQELRVGDVLARTTWGRPILLETNTAVMVQRPEPFSAWVNPAKEINAMRRHVSQVVIPILLTGLQLPQGLPPVLQLGDSGQSNRERLSAGGWEDAEVRLAEIVQSRYQEAMNRDVQFPKVVDETGSDNNA